LASSGRNKFKRRKGREKEAEEKRKRIRGWRDEGEKKSEKKEYEVGIRK